MNTLKLLSRSALALALLTSPYAFADGIPQQETIVYSSTLYEHDRPVHLMGRMIRVRFFSQSTGTSSPLCDTEQTIMVSHGIFRLPLEAACVAAIRSAAEVWVQVDVAGTMVSRTKLGAAPFAVEADRAQTAEQLASPPVVAKCRLETDEIAAHNTNYSVPFTGCPVNLSGAFVQPGTGFYFRVPRDGVYRVSAQVHGYRVHINDDATQTLTGNRSFRIDLVRERQGQRVTIGQGYEGKQISDGTGRNAQVTIALKVASVVQLQQGDQISVVFAQTWGVNMIVKGHQIIDKTFLTIEEIR